MPSIWFAPWEEHEGGYRAPGGGNIGVADLRRYDQMASLGQEGHGIFVYRHRERVPNGYYLGRDPEGYLSRSALAALEALLGVRPQETQVRKALRELYLAHADPTGIERWGPLGIDRRNGFDLPLGGFGWLYRERFSPDHPAFPITLARHRAAYARHAREGLPLAVRRRWTGAQMLAYFGYTHDSLVAGLLPEEYWGDGWAHPDTAVSDDFFRDDEDLADGNWDVLAGTWQVVDQEVQATGDGTANMARYRTALSTADHYGQVTFSSATSNQGLMAPAIRVSSTSTVSGFEGVIRGQGSERRINLWVDSVATTLVLDNDGGGPEQLIRLVGNGNNISLRQAGVTVFTVPDNSLPSNLHVGLSGHLSQTISSKGRAFSGADLVEAETTVTQPSATATLSTSPMRATLPRGRSVGVQDIIASGATEGQLFKTDGEGGMGIEDDLVAVNFVIDGGGSAITTGQKGHVEIPFDMVIEGWSIIADQSGSIVVDVWRGDDYTDIPTDDDSIAGTELPTLSSEQSNQDLSLTSWTTTINAGNILAFNVDSATTVQRVTVSIRGRRT